MSGMSDVCPPVVSSLSNAKMLLDRSKCVCVDPREYTPDTRAVVRFAFRTDRMPNEGTRTPKTENTHADGSTKRETTIKAIEFTFC